MVRAPAPPLPTTAIEMLGDKERTAAEARRYLKDYPQGFGREEATSASRAAGARP